MSDENANRKIAIGESLFTHYENKQIWVIGMIDTNTNEFRIVPTFSRNSNTLKDIVLRYIRPGNTLITDAWSGYINQIQGFIILSIITDMGSLGMLMNRHHTLSNYGLFLKGFLKEFMFLLQENILFYF